MKPFTVLTARAVVLHEDDIDTDQIVPARFLVTTGRAGLGRRLFADRRRDPAFPLDRPGADAAEVLVVGDNFGCGSSREHAVWALLDHPFRAVIARSVADIFHANALRNGLVVAVLEADAHEALCATLDADPEAAVTVDLERRSVRCGEVDATFPFDPFARHCILRGRDELDVLLSLGREIDAYERRAAATIDTRGGRR